VFTQESVKYIGVIKLSLVIKAAHSLVIPILLLINIPALTGPDKQIKITFIEGGDYTNKKFAFQEKKSSRPPF